MFRLEDLLQNSMLLILQQQNQLIASQKLSDSPLFANRRPKLLGMIFHRQSRKGALVSVLVTDSRHPNRSAMPPVSKNLVILTQIIGSPDPGNYNIKSEFEIGRPGTCNTDTKAGIYSFGIGRDKYEKVYMPSKKGNMDPEQPGPGTYTSSIYTVGTEGRKFAF